MGSEAILEQVDRIRGQGGRELIVQRVSPPRPRGAALFVHGIQSHAGWYMDTARSLAAAGIEVAIPERRGSGRDVRDRGDAPTPGALLEDARLVGAHLARVSGGHRPVWVGISWGGKIAYLVARDHPEEVRALALVVPGICPRIDLTRLEQLRVLAAMAVGGRMRLPIPLQDAGLFSDDPRWQEYVAGDSLCLRDATARFFVGSRWLDLDAARDRGLPPSMRVFLVLASRDEIVDGCATRSFLERRVSGPLEVLELPGTRHTPEFGPDAAWYRERLERFALGAGGVPRTWWTVETPRVQELAVGDHRSRIP